MKISIKKTPSCSLSQSIAQESSKLITLISQLPLHDFRVKKYEGTGGLVSVADILAYQIGWATLVIEWYTNGINNRTFVMPGEGFTTWNYNGLSLHFYRKYETISHNELIQTFSTLVTTIITIVEKEYTLHNLDALGIWPWCRLQSGKEWPLSKWIQVKTVSPYKRAQQIIKKGMKSEKK